MDSNDSFPTDIEQQQLERFLAVHPTGSAADLRAWAGGEPGMEPDAVSRLLRQLEEHERVERVLGELPVMGEIQGTFFRRGVGGDGSPEVGSDETPGLGKYQANQRVGHFILRRFIASGGMGQVWEAQDENLRSTVALKLVLPGRISPRTLELFAREARAGGRLVHPNIVRTQCPSELAIIVGKALEKDPARRYATMAEFAADLRHHMANEPILAKPPGVLARGSKWARRNPTLSSTATLGLIALIVVSLLLSRLSASNEDLELQTRAAISRAAELEWRDYLHSVRSASSALDKGKVSQAADILASCEAPVEDSWEWRWLESRLDNCVKVFEVPGGGVYEGLAELSVDGRLVTILSEDQRLRAVDVVTGEVLYEHGKFDREVTGSHGSPNGEVVLVLFADLSAQVVDAGTGEGVVDLEGLSAHVRCTAFSPDSERVLTADREGGLIVWDVATGAQLAKPAGHSRGAWSCSFSPDGTQILSRDQRAAPVVWDSWTGESVAVLEDHATHY